MKSEVVVEAIKNACKKASPGFEQLLEVHLKNNTGKGFELAYEDPKKFREVVIKILGEYSYRLLELLALQEIRRELGISEELNSLEEAVKVARDLR